MNLTTFSIINSLCYHICFVFTCWFLIRINKINPEEDFLKSLFIFFIIYIGWAIIGGVIYGYQRGLWKNENKSKRNNK